MGIPHTAQMGYMRGGRRRDRASALERAGATTESDSTPWWQQARAVCYAAFWPWRARAAVEHGVARHLLLFGDFQGAAGISMTQGQTTSRDGETSETANSDIAQVAATSGDAGAGQRQPLIEARLDLTRAARKGIPEVVLAETKSDAQLVAIVRAFLERNGYALVSRARPAQIALLAREFPQAEHDRREAARAIALRAPGYQPPATGGHVGILTAGSGDVPVAEEARLVVEAMGCRVTTIYDVGVAGIHRLFGPLAELLEEEVDALVVCAGMDGALPSVVAGLSPAPVIGCPTSIGYGAGGKGRAALLSMLQTCAPGLTVVNIDNGVGAGATAALIANRMAAARDAAPRAGPRAGDD